MVFPIEARALERRSAKGDVLLRASFRIDAGDRIALSGPSGAGKTLLLRALAALDPPSGGTLVEAGAPVTDVPVYRSHVLYVHQRPSLFAGTVADNLALPFRLRVRRGQAFDRARAVALLDRLGKPESFLEKPHDALSGGEAQVASLVRALLVGPRVLLLDEPTASLDAASTAKVVAVVEEWVTAERALVVTSHDDAVRAALGRRVVSVEGGVVT